MFIDEWTKKQMSVVSLRATTKIKDNEDGGFKGVKEKIAICVAPLNLFHQIHTFVLICHRLV